MKIFLSAFFSLLFVVIPLSYAAVGGGPGGEMLLKPISQGDSPWRSGSVAEIDDEFRDDSDYIQSRLLGKQAKDIVEFKFEPGLDAHQDYNHILRIVYKQSEGLNSAYLTVALKQGETVIEEWTYDNLPNTFTEDLHVLSPDNVGKITDYGNLWVYLNAWCDLECVSTEKVDVSVSMIDFSYHRTRHDETNILPTIIGVGIYQIEKQDEFGKYSDNLMRDNFEGMFSTYLPYDKQTDENDLIRYGQDSEYQKTGTFFFTEKDHTIVPTTNGLVNTPTQFQILIHDDYNSERIEHVGLYDVLTGNEQHQIPPLFEISLEKGQKVDVINKNNIVSGVKSSWSNDDEYLWVSFDLIFDEILPLSDFILEVWDQQRIPVRTNVYEVLDIKNSRDSTENDEVNLTADVIMSHDSSSPVCKINFQCFRPYIAVILETGIVTWKNYDDAVHSVVGGDGEPNNRFAYNVLPGKSVQHRFDIEGEYHYFCDIHPWARGKVLVMDPRIPEKPNYSSRDDAPLEIYSVTNSGSLLVHNNDQVIKENRDLWFEIIGHASEDNKSKRVQVMIIKPDGSETKLTSSTNENGFYNLPISLHEKWLEGEYTIITTIKKIEIGRVTFSVTS
ncbi:MAG: hypothetical protein VW081_01540 [Nitrosopumilus sp.]